MWESLGQNLGRHGAAFLPGSLRQLATKAGVAALLASATLFGQAIPGRYIVELSSTPAAGAAARSGPRLAARDTGFAARRAAVRQGQVAARRAVTDRGGTVMDSMDTVVNGLIVNIPDGRAAELLQIPGVVRIHEVQLLKMSLDHALPVHQVPAAWATLPLGQDSAGAGIKIGIIDSGIDVTHPAFRDPLPPVAGFPKVLATTDLKYTNAKIIVAKNYTTLLGDGGDLDADDHFGHGTGTSMAAAGGPAVSPFGPIVGVAPKAYLGNYKVSDDSGSTTAVIVKAIDDAVADGMDVINISLGGYVTSYSDVDPDNIAIAALESAARAGVVVTVSAGNDGPWAGTIQNLASASDVIAVGAIRNDRAMGYAVRVSGASPYLAEPGDGPTPSQAFSGALVDAASVDPTGQACSPLPAGSVNGKVVLILRGTCTFETKINDAAAGGAVAVIVYNNAGSGLVRMGVGTASLPAVFIAEGDGIDVKARLASASTLEVTIDFSGLTAIPVRTDLSTFSSRGPSIGSAMKPDLVAVGEEFLTAAQSTHPNGELYNGSGYMTTQGTSFSAPLTAGAAAVLKGARPGLTMAQYRSLLINSAGAASVSAEKSATLQQAGAGILNLAAAVSGTVAAYPTSLNFGTAGRSLNLSLSNVSTAADTFSLSVATAGDGPKLSLSTDSLQLQPNGSAQLSVNLDATGLAAGEYQGFVQVTGTASQNVARIPYWFAVAGSAPAGISVLHSANALPARANVDRAVVFRVLDAAGLPLAGSDTPRATISTDGTVRRVYRVGTIPGTYAVDVRAGSSTLQLEISVGGVTQIILIPVG